MAGLWSVALRGALDAFSALGLDAARIRDEAGVRAASIEDPDARIPLATTGRIWPAAAAQWGRPGLGLSAGGALSFGKLEALDYALATAGTVGEGLARLSRYWDVVTGGATSMRCSRSRKDRTAVLELRGYALPDLRDYALAAAVLRLSVLGAPPASITVAGPPRAPRRDYVGKLGCPVELHAEATALFLPDASLDRPTPLRYPGLRTAVDRELERQLAAARKEADPLAEIRREVASMLGPTAPTLAGVAARLGVSPRQLQRRLESGGSSFTRAVEDARRSLAEIYVEHGSLGVAEIAYLLGYSEPSAFSRAFKRWTGRAPGHARGRGAART